MPRKGRKARPAAAFVDDEAGTSSPPAPAQKGRNESQQSAAPTHYIDSPAKHTRSQEQEQPCSPEKETEFKPRKSLRRTLTQNEEDDLVTWLRENTFLYDKSSAEFKFKEKKSRTWAAKEAELGLNPGDLSFIWYPNMRTQFSKLVKVSSKSGSGAAERTARQKWILDSFGFLRPYLVQLRNQRGSKFAEKRKELTLEETYDRDAASESASGSRPKAARVLSSLASELESVRGAITGAQDAAAQTGQFLVYLMRQMDQQRMNVFVTHATRLALDLVDKSQEEKLRLAAQEAAQQVAQQTAALVFAVPTLPTLTSSTNRRWTPAPAAFGSLEQQQQSSSSTNFSRIFGWPPT